MGTPRPTIRIDDLDLDSRPHPKYQAIDYDLGHRFSFRLGTYEGYWRWPWPEWVGLPTRNTAKEWFEILDEWKSLAMKPEHEDRVEQFVNGLVPYL